MCVCMYVFIYALYVIYVSLSLIISTLLNNSIMNTEGFFSVEYHHGINTWIIDES